MKIVITGTSRGIGFELAQQFANEGHQCFGTYQEIRNL